ncbi:nucleotide disphospho-sugar-binding domain-containing protein [Streptomyces sp. NPDC002537]
MRILFVAGSGAGTIFPGVPLAQAARTAGHEVIMTGPEAAMPTVIAAGIPAFPVTSRTLFDCRSGPTPPGGPERDIALGRVFGRLGAYSLDGLLDLVDRWRPDVVVSNVLAYAGPLAAHYAGVPWVRFATDIGEPLVIDLAAAAQLAPELERLGLRDMPAPAFSISVMPPSVRPATAPVALPMRHVPYSTQRSLEPWMCTKGDRPRVLVSIGSRVTPDFEFDLLSDLVEKVAPLDAELLIATPDDVVEKLGPLPNGARAGWLPLDVLAPTCDLMVHHAGSSTTLTSLAHGVPQLFVPNNPGLRDHGERISAQGAARMIGPEGDGADDIAAAIRDMLVDPSYRSAAERLRDEMHRMPVAADVVREIERAVAVHRESAAR